MCIQILILAPLEPFGHPGFKSEATTGSHQNTMVFDYDVYSDIDFGFLWSPSTVQGPSMTPPPDDCGF